MSSTTIEFRPMATTCAQKGCDCAGSVLVFRTDWDSREHQFRYVCAEHASQAFDRFQSAGALEIVQGNQEES